MKLQFFVERLGETHGVQVTRELVHSVATRLRDADLLRGDDVVDGEASTSVACLAFGGQGPRYATAGINTPLMVAPATTSCPNCQAMLQDVRIGDGSDAPAGKHCPKCHTVLQVRG